MAEPFLSKIRSMSFVYAPRGWALCNGYGQLLPINQFQSQRSTLFEAITRPAIVRGVHPGTHRVDLDSDNTRRDSARDPPDCPCNALSQGPTAPIAVIGVSHIVPSNRLHELASASGLWGVHQQMDMVGHDHIGV